MRISGVEVTRNPNPGPNPDPNPNPNPNPDLNRDPYISTYIIIPR